MWYKHLGLTHRMMASEPVIAVQEGGFWIKIGSSVTVSTWWLSNRLKTPAATNTTTKALHVSAVLLQVVVLVQ